MAEWSKALDLGSSHFDGVGSNPTAATPVMSSLFHLSTLHPLGVVLSYPSSLFRFLKLSFFFFF